MTAKDELKEIALRLPLRQDTRMRCVFCVEQRKSINQNQTTLSVTRFEDRVVYNCWHCHEQGAVSLREKERNYTRTQHIGDTKMAQPLRQEAFTDLNDDDDSFLNSRGISLDTARKIGLKHCNFGVAFPCATDTNNVIGYKARNRDTKDFRVAGSVPGLMLLHTVVGDSLIITEGEIDAASFWEAGIEYAASVPSGAPDPKFVTPERMADMNLGWLSHDAERLQGFKRIYLALDNDPPGKLLQAEIARRLGKARCYEVQWPSGCKDANDVLLRHGVGALKEMIAEAKAMQIPGLHGAEYFRTDLLRMRHGDLGRGFSTGLGSLDPFYTVAPGNWTCVTGHPGSGKSEIVDQIHVNLAEMYGWNIAYFSAENPGHEHVAKLIEKRVRKRFHPHMKNRMSEQDMEDGYQWVDKHFQFLTDECSSTMESILERMTAAVMRSGVKSACIDPFNYINLPGKKRDDIEISDILSLLGNWCKSHEVAMFFIAHPKKTPIETIPKGFDIAGAAAWWAKTDFGLTVHRPDSGQFVEAHVWKVRRSHLGKTGSVEIGYNNLTASYYDLDEVGISMKPQFKKQAEERSKEIGPFWYDDDQRNYEND